MLENNTDSVTCNNIISIFSISTVHCIMKIIEMVPFKLIINLHLFVSYENVLYVETHL